MIQPASKDIQKPRASASVRDIDIADLIGLLVSLEAPSRDVDNIVEIMVAGEKVLPSASLGAVVSSRWLSGETPRYTAGGQALSVLARRRGCRISCVPSGNGYSSEAWNLRTGVRTSASARLEGAAGIAAIIRLAAMAMPNE